MDTFQCHINTADLLTSIYLTTCFGLIQSLLSQIPGSDCCFTPCNKAPFKLSQHLSAFVISLEGGLSRPKHVVNWYTECNRRNVRDFGRVFLMSNYTDIT